MWSLLSCCSYHLYSFYRISQRLCYLGTLRQLESEPYPGIHQSSTTNDISGSPSHHSNPTYDILQFRPLSLIRLRHNLKITQHPSDSKSTKTSTFLISIIHHGSRNLVISMVSPLCPFAYAANSYRIFKRVNRSSSNYIFSLRLTERGAKVITIVHIPKNR